MHKPLLLGLLATSLLTVNAGALAQPNLPTNLPKTVVRPKLFNTSEELVRWAENYHRDPRPDLLDEAFRFFLDSDLSSDETKRVELAAFFGGALARTPAMAPAVRDAALRDGTYESMFALVNTLWMADIDECRAMIRAMAEKEPDARVREYLVRRAQATPPTADGPSIETLSQMNLLWWRFAATGEARIPERVTGIVLTRFETSPQAQLFQQAAQDSLRKRGDSVAVREGVRAAIEKAPPSPMRDDAQALLDEITGATGAGVGPSPAP